MEPPEFPGQMQSCFYADTRGPALPGDVRARRCPGQPLPQEQLGSPGACGFPAEPASPKTSLWLLSQAENCLHNTQMQSRVMEPSEAPRERAAGPGPAPSSMRSMP